MASTAELYRMVTDEHVCPYGLKSKHLLEADGFEVIDRPLKSRVETERFKARHGVETTPQTFIDGRRVGGFEDLQRYFGQQVRAADETTYQPVIAIFSVAFLMAAALGIGLAGTPFSVRVAEWFIAISMCFLAVQKLQDIESFSTMFLNYDLLARRWVPYGRIYPFGEAVAGILMFGGILPAVSVPIALFIGTVGAVSVFKAVYIDRREIKCACVGGSSNVPLGFISLTENLMMIAMGIWMGAKAIT